MTKATKARTAHDRSGRPKDAMNRAYDQADAPASRCRVCGSTDRTPYERRTIVRGGGVDPQFGEFNIVVFRPTCCRKCGQWRNDRTLLSTEGELPDDEVDSLLG